MAVEYRDLLDDYEAGEIAVELDDKDPQEVIAWSIERFQRNHLAICTSFQSDGMAILDMAWRIDPNVRVFTRRTLMPISRAASILSPTHATCAPKW